MRTLTFQLVPPEHRESILASLGRHLQHLAYVYCDDIDLVEFESCTQLEEVKLNSFEEIYDSIDDGMPNQIILGLKTLELELSNQNFHQFLPFAYTFKSKSLTSLRINCYEWAKTKNIQDWNFSWEELPTIWPCVERLTLVSNNETVSARFLLNWIRPILPQLTNLKSLTLPCNIRTADNWDEEEKLRNDLIAELEQPPNPIELKFENRRRQRFWNDGIIYDD